MAEISGKVFKHYPELSSKLQKRVIDKMEAYDRFRFIRCSKLCSREAKSSKKFIHELNVHRSYAECIKFKVTPGKDLEPHEYTLNFSERNGKIYMAYHSFESGTSFENELDSSHNLNHYFMEELQTRMRNYQFSVKKLGLNGVSQFFNNTKLLKNIDFGIESLDCLEELDILGDMDIISILSKLRKPLKILSIKGIKCKEELKNCEQIYQVQDNLDWSRGALDIEQIFKLSAKNINLHIGTLSEKDIFEFITSWQDGELGKEVEIYRWSLERTIFSKAKLYDLLKIENYTLEEIVISHSIEEGRTARISIDQPSLTFNAGIGEYLRVNRKRAAEDAGFEAL